jgi:hypothetical protein
MPRFFPRVATVRTHFSKNNNNKRAMLEQQHKRHRNNYKNHDDNDYNAKIFHFGRAHLTKVGSVLFKISRNGY